jgi:hypothetical protein
MYSVLHHLKLNTIVVQIHKFINVQIYGWKGMEGLGIGRKWCVWELVQELGIGNGREWWGMKRRGQAGVHFD